jgi:AcrR family transcriptional regulator
MPRIVKDPDERRSEFIATAQKLFYAKGYERTSVNDIINEMGVSKGAFYHYFDSKQAILEAVVAELIAQALAHFEAIVADDALNAIQKWMRAFQVINDWKIERKDELLAVARVMQADENVLLYHKMQMQRAQMMVPIFTSIITQGIEEGVFETAYVVEAAEIVTAVWQTMSATLNGIVLNLENYDHPEALARRKVAAWQIALERILCAAPGSLPLIDEQTLAAWFEDRV